MRAVVTGGAGFIGSHIVDELIGLGHEVVVVDDLDPAAHRGVPDGLHPDARYVWADVRDGDVWPPLLAGADAVCLAAARAVFFISSAARCRTPAGCSRARGTGSATSSFRFP